MTNTRKSVAGKTVPGQKRVPTAGKTLPGEKRVPRSSGGKTVPKEHQSTEGRKSVAGKSLPGEKRVPRGPGGKTIPQQQQPTKRQLKLATVRDPGADGHERGIVAGSGDSLMWKDESGEETVWMPAVYHNDIRQKLLAKANNDGQLVYDHPRRRGYLPHDETAFLLSQQNWGPDRSIWHHIPDDLLNRLDRLDYKGKEYDVSYMFDVDTSRIVLDMDNHPIVDYEDIPSVLSSNFGMQEEGYLLEAIRRIDMRIQRTDFLARMPWLRKSTEKGKVLPIFTLSSIGNREYRWRKDNAIVAWTQRSGSKNLRAYIVNKLSQDGRANNSTRELAGGLTKEEKEEAERPNKGAMMSKAGKRLLPDDKRTERENKLNQAKDRPETTRRSTKRKASVYSDDSDDDHCEDDVTSHHAKRVKVNEHHDTAHNDSQPVTESPDHRILQPDEHLSSNHPGLGSPQKQPSMPCSSLTAGTVPGSRSSGIGITTSPISAALAPTSGRKRQRATSLEAPEDVETNGSPRSKRQKTDEAQHQQTSHSLTHEPGPHTALSTLAPYQSNCLPSFQLSPLSCATLPEFSTLTTPPLDDSQNLNLAMDKPSSSDDINDNSSHTATNTADTSPSNSSKTHAEQAEDYRFKQPQSAADAFQIEEALSLTRDSFTNFFGSDIYGHGGPPTAYYDSYAEQYATLQDHSTSLQSHEPETFRLNHWGPWLGGFDKWRGTKISNENFLEGMEVTTDATDEADDAPASDALFEEFTSGIL